MKKIIIFYHFRVDLFTFTKQHSVKTGTTGVLWLNIRRVSTQKVTCIIK